MDDDRYTTLTALDSMHRRRGWRTTAADEAVDGDTNRRTYTKGASTLVVDYHTATGAVEAYT